EDAERFLAMPIPPPAPLTLLSSSLLQIPSPPLLASPPILPIPLPAASPPLQLLSSDRKADRPKVTLPPLKRTDYGFVDSVDAEIRQRRAEDIRYGIRDTWIDLRDVAEEEALTTLEGVNTRDQRIDAQDTLIATLTTQLSSVQGYLATALGEIRALQAREQARAGAPEGASSST
nr:hypothetical protein [Tanacetum cinerariifolium]